MHALQSKLRVIYLPFLLIAVGCVAGYSLINWFVFTQAKLFVLDEDVINFWIPCGVPWIPILVWLRPRLKALRLTGGKGNLPFLFQFVAAWAITAPTIVSQNYLTTATGELTHLQRISLISHSPRTKYYAVRDVFPDKANTSTETTVAYAGKHNEYLNVSIFLTCPLTDPGSPATWTAGVWLGTVYKQQISSRITDDQRHAQIRAIIESFMTQYNQSDLRPFSYLERAHYGDGQRGFQAAIAKSTYHQPDIPMTVLVAHQEDFAERNGNKAPWILGSFAIGAVVWLIMVLVAPLDEVGMASVLSGRNISGNALDETFAIFLPRRGAIATPILLDLNILVFAAMVLAGLGFISFNSKDLVSLGGNYGPAVRDGQIWRLVTSMFLHGGLIHLTGC